MMLRSFANLVGGASPKAKAPTADIVPGEPDPEAMDGEDDGVEIEIAPAEDDAPEDDTEAMDGEDEASPEARRAFRRGVAQGRKAERSRAAAIFAAAGPDTVALAATLAFSTGVSPAEAKATLAAAPRASGGLAARMAGRDPAPAGGASTAAESSLPPELAAASARLVALKKVR